MVWNRVVGTPVALAEEEDLSWEAQNTLVDPEKHLQSRDGIANASLRNLGMGCCSTHNSECSQVTEVGRKACAATVPLAMQGTHMAAHDAADG